MNEDDRYGPTVDLGAARRDPALSIGREPPRPSNPSQPTRREAIGGGTLILIAAVAAPIVIGFLLHLVWAAIMLGWTIV